MRACVEDSAGGEWMRVEVMCCNGLPQEMDITNTLWASTRSRAKYLEWGWSFSDRACHAEAQN